MQQHYAERFERDMACTEAEWLRWFPLAVGDHPWVWMGPRLCEGDCNPAWEGSARVDLPNGHLLVGWHALPPRVIALLKLPRIKVYYRFTGVAEADRNRFMRRFDLHTQRGGG